MSDGERKRPKRLRKPNFSEPIDLSVLEKTPPHDLDAERAVLGALLREPELCDDVVMVLREPDDFYHDAHKRIFSHLMKMRSDNSKIDLLLLVNNLKTTDELELVGGQFYLGELMTSVPISAHAEHYAKIVKEKATLRKLIHAGSDIVRDAYAPETQTRDLLNKAATQMNMLCEAQTTNQVTDMEALMTAADDYLYRKEKGFVDGIKTGFVELDNLIDGLHPNELIILAARPGMGKTALALNIADNVAVKDKQTVLFVSLEMAKLELALRLICSRAQLDSVKVRKNFLSKEDRTGFGEACGEMNGAPLYVDDTPSRTVMEIAAVARRLKRQQDLKLLIIDYIGLITPENPMEPRQEQVAKIARQLKLLARELHVPVLCLSQLNRQADGSRDERPRLSQLRESGAIEQDADVVMFVHRRDMGMTNDEITEKESRTNRDIRDRADLIVAKQRNGPTDDIELIFRKEFTRFLCMSEHHTRQYKKDFEQHGESSASSPTGVDFGD